MQCKCRIAVIVMAVMAMVFGVAGSAQASVTVGTCCTNECDFTTIAAALNDTASVGQEVIVCPGEYSEPQLRVRSRTLRSTQPTNPGATTITNNDGRSVIQASGISTESTIEGFTITGGNTSDRGGGVVLMGGKVVLKHLTIEGNTAPQGGGVGGITGGTILTIEQCTIRHNFAVSRGGGVEGGTSSTTIKDSTITNNVVTNGSGGGVFLPIFSTAVISNTTITQNVASGTQRGDGGGIFSNANLTLSGVTLQNNFAIDGTTFSSGGGLYASGTGSLYFNGGSVSGNFAGKGGGIYVRGGGSIVNISVSVSGNTATEPPSSGGGIFCGASIHTLAGTVSGNSPDEVVGCGDSVNPDEGTTRVRADTENGGDTLDPISTRTGSLYDQYDPDINLGGPMPLSFSRYYSSEFKQVGIFASMGDNWRHNFDWKLTLIGTTIHIVDHHGRTIQFSQNGLAWDLVGKMDVVYQLVESAGVYTLLDPRDQRAYVFDSSGLLTSISDGRGNVHTLSYANGPLTQVSDGLGRVLNFTYDANNNLTSVDDDLGRTVGFAYTDSYLSTVTDLTGHTTVFNYATLSVLDGWGLLTSMVRPAGNIPFRHGYWFADLHTASETDSNGNKTIIRYISATETTIEDPLGNIRMHTHTATGELSISRDNAGQNVIIGSDATGRRNSITDRLGDVTTMSYHAPSGKLASRTNADGTTTSITYTERVTSGLKLHDLTGVTHADATTESFAYDANGNLLSHTDQAGHTLTGTYNANGQPLTATNVAGGVTTHTYNTDATRLSTTDPAGNLTNYGYDSLRRPNLITRPGGSTVEFTYDNADRLLTTTDENGNTTTLTYDLNGNLNSVADPLNNTHTFAYDGNDRQLSVTDAEGGVASQSYDQIGRVGTTTDPLNNVTTYGYDIHNRLTSVTDPLLNVRSSTYDAEGIVASRTDPLLNTTSFVSDKMGRITQVASPLGNTANISYDAMGRVNAATDALGNTTTFSREARGLLSGVTLPGGVISTTYARNALGQMTDLTDPNGNSWTRAYDSSGRLTSSTDPLLQVTSLTYDNRNRPSLITLPGALGSQTNTFDAAGNLTGVSYSDGTTFGFSYDANDRLIAADSGGADNVTRSYDANGRINNSNGIAVTRDLNGRIASMTLAPGKAVTYTYDANDRLITVTDWTAGVTAFSYDAADRLTAVTRPNGVNTTNTWDSDSRLTGIVESGVSSILLTRDAKGQITSATRNVPQPASAISLSSSSHSFDAAAQIIDAAYDAAGRLTAAGGDSFSWDLATRLTNYTVGGNTVSNSYDALGRRTSRTAGGVTREFVWNDALGLTSISIEKQGGADFRYYIHAPGGSLLYSMDATTDARNFYHYDEMGNALLVTDDAGAVIGSYAYTPFGALIASSGGLDNLFTWQGRFGVTDEENGFYYIRARYYDSGAGRFLSRDPIRQSDPKSVNPYQYAWGNPMRFVDPSGRDPSVEVLTYSVAAREGELDAALTRRREQELSAAALFLAGHWQLGMLQVARNTGHARTGDRVEVSLDLNVIHRQRALARARLDLANSKRNAETCVVHPDNPDNQKEQPPANSLDTGQPPTNEDSLIPDLAGIIVLA